MRKELTMSLVVRRPYPLVVLLALCALAVALALVALPQLAAGASSKILEVDAHDTIATGDFGQVIADCPADYEATGGGYTIESVNPANFIEMNAPLPPETNDGVWGWAVSMLNESGVSVRLDVSVLCMK
jgi:hypothetical protein